MLPEDPRELLRLYGAAKAPPELSRERSWRGITKRVAAGDPGPALETARGAAQAAASTATGGVTALLVKALAVVVTASALVGGGVWLGARRAATPGAVGRGNEAAPPATAARSPSIAARAGSCRGLDGPYVDPRHLAGEPGDDRPAFLHPWRAWLDTPPATRLQEGLGAMLYLGDLADGADAERSIATLARHGVRSVQFELPWDHLSFEREQFEGPFGRRAAAVLAACRRHGVRPTIRVVGYEVAPCPTRRFNRRVAAAARAGDRTLVLDDVRDLVPGRSGIAHLSHGVAPEILVTDVRGQTVSLAKPLPFDLPEARPLAMVTLKYRPLAAPGTTDFQDTLGGWKRYLDAVANLAASALGTVDAAEKGFDLEVWNSVSFASSFLFAGRYHDPPGPGADDDRAWRQLGLETARHVAAHPERFGGVRLIDGFATHARDACVEQPAPFAGIRRATPGALVRPLLQNEDGTVSDPFLWPWPGARSRGARIGFPEVEATSLVPESFVRDLAAAATGQGCPVWISGAGIDPRVLAPIADVERSQALEAKLLLRQYSFYLGKGARRLVVSAFPQGAADDRAAGLLALGALRPRPAAAATDDAHVTPGLAALHRLVVASATGAESATPRRLEVRGVSDCHDAVQFRGGPGEPALYNREVLVVQPFQVSARRFAVHHYVMTRDTTADLAPETYTITLAGVAPTAQVRAHDPLRGRDVPVRSEARGGDLVVTVAATDYPRVLLIDE